MLSDFSRNHFFDSCDRTSDLLCVFCHTAVESALDRHSDRDCHVGLSGLCIVGNAIQMTEIHSAACPAAVRRAAGFFPSPA